MKYDDDKFFYHFIAGAMLVMALLITPLVFMLLEVIWHQGFTFITVLTVGIAVFSWATHKIAVFIQAKADW